MLTATTESENSCPLWLLPASCLGINYCVAASENEKLHLHLAKMTATQETSRNPSILSLEEFEQMNTMMRQDL